MKRGLLTKILLIGCLSLAVPGAMAAELKGKVTARKNGALMVGFAGDVTSAPAQGDKVVFSLMVQGIKVRAGEGKVAEVGADYVWVDQLTGKANLNHDATNKDRL